MHTSKPKLAIIGTFDDLCGIAAYVKTMVRLLGEHFDISVFDLDQFIFKHPSPSVQRLAEAEIQQIAEALRGFDAVNIQLEHGLFGTSANMILRRLKKIIRASPTLVITFHTILSGERASLRSLVRSALRGHPLRGLQEFRQTRHDNVLTDAFYSFIRREQRRRKRRNPISIVVHTRRDSRMMRLVHGLKNIHDHPLAQLTPDRVAEIRSRADRSRFPGLGKIPPDAILLGCFGFLSPYKGFDTAIKAVALLPKHYHLGIFGATHPGGTKPFSKRDAYVTRLLSLVHAGQRLLSLGKRRRLNVSVNGKDLPEIMAIPNPADISERVHFLGALSDDDFPVAIAVCDSVLLPYREVGQSSSGPLCLGIELGKHVIATRTKAFLQAQRYYKNRYRTIDIDNHVELAQAVEAESRVGRDYPLPTTFNAETNRAMYVALLSGEQPENVGSTTSSTSHAADVNMQQKLSPVEEVS
jgi:glycosyltransferase involved in cell wall biosynthesis